MNKKFLIVLFSLMLSILCVIDVFAASGDVVYDGKQIKVNSQADFSDLLPGETISYEITLANNGSKRTDWYIANNVLSSFEDKNAKGGAYTYALSYNGNELYNSENIGGKGVDGLKQLNDETNGKFFYLGSIEPSGNGKITVKVGLDGESQANDYMNALADLELRFAVEEENVKTEKKVVKYYQPKTAIEGMTSERDLRNYYLLIGASMVMMAASAGYLLSSKKEVR
ncbi:MAG: hypothetical protein IJI66_13845 [Erysipelotrichaceae bacterium]|nr:hypothetical protein [Erysipelotrichaceae bacterium]